MMKRILNIPCGRWGIFLLLLGFCILLLCLSVGGREEDPPVLLVRQEKGTGGIGIYGDIYGLTGDCPAAILLEVNAPEGRRWQDVSVGEGAEGMTLTHGELEGKTVKILLDGVFPEGSESPLLWLWPDSPFGQGEGITVTGEGGGEPVLYVLGDGGHVERIPLSVVWEEREPETDGETPETETGGASETETGGASETTDIHDGAESDTVLDLVCPPPLDADPPPTATFLGCRETGIVGGTYAVQLLFGGEGEGTPVLCMEGGGLLYVSCGTMDGLDGARGREASRFCMLQGLLADRRYVFWVGTEEGFVTVTYEGGRFMGFGWGNASPT